MATLWLLAFCWRDAAVPALRPRSLPFPMTPGPRPHVASLSPAPSPGHYLSPAPWPGCPEGPWCDGTTSGSGDERVARPVQLGPRCHLGVLTRGRRRQNKRWEARPGGPGVEARSLEGPPLLLLELWPRQDACWGGTPRRDLDALSVPCPHGPPEVSVSLCSPRPPFPLNSRCLGHSRDPVALHMGPCPCPAARDPSQCRSPGAPGVTWAEVTAHSVESSRGGHTVASGGQSGAPAFELPIPLQCHLGRVTLPDSSGPQPPSPVSCLQPPFG